MPGRGNGRSAYLNPLGRDRSRTDVETTKADPGVRSDARELEPESGLLLPNARISPHPTSARTASPNRIGRPESLSCTT